MIFPTEAMCFNFLLKMYVFQGRGFGVALGGVASALAWLGLAWLGLAWLGLASPAGFSAALFPTEEVWIRLAGSTRKYNPIELLGIGWLAQ